MSLEEKIEILEQKVKNLEEIIEELKVKHSQNVEGEIAKKIKQALNNLR